ncbi:MAG: NADH-quinone oxidoreductase subunit NuoK [Nitrospirae bacterium]|nr:NADH-quinone oxidoreductase subunit NuoK [Nitrospirota bacterium]MBI5695931.1 NADH-quinone oxidoreductase subunit NuoK [Nitrospirota bacterium]
MVPISHILILAGMIFALGVVCVFAHRNILMILIGVEIMLNAAGLAFVAGSMRWGMPEGQIFVLFLMAMAASEVSVGLALVVYLHKRKRSVNIDDFNEMKD